MKKLFATLAAAAFSISTLAAVVPASAQVHAYDSIGRGGFHHGGWHGHHGGWHGHHGVYRHGGRGYYHGHRGYRHWRRGYRYYNGFWFPAAILGGAIIGNALASRPVYHGGNAHVRWCYDHYRSYRASDNTFQPYHGPRQQCVGP